MTLIALFLAIFVVGPLFFCILTARAATVTWSRKVALLAIGCAAVALMLRYGTPAHWGRDPLVTGLAIGMMWIGWISVLAFAVLALRRADSGVMMRRLSTVLGAGGTTIPWFGLIWASYSIT